MSVSASVPGPGPRVLNYSRLASQHLAASWHRVMTPGEMLGCDEARLWGDGLTKSWSHVSLWVNDGFNTDINDCLQRVNGMPITSMQNIQAKRQNNFTEKILFCMHCLMGSDVSISSSYADIGIWWDRDGLTRYLSGTLRTLGSPQSSVQCPELRVIQTPAYHQHGKIFIQEYKGEMYAIHWDSQSKGRLKSVFRKEKG